MARLRVVVTGRHGQLARSILETGPARRIEVVAVGRPELDLTDPSGIEAAITAAKPQVLVNAAGYTNTEQAEDEPDLARLINVDGAAAVATSARKLGVPLIHLSSSYVFDGRSTAPYRESDPVGPLGAYGRTKLEGEAAVAAALPAHVILRASLVFSPFGTNTLSNLLKRADHRDEIRVVSDQRVNPTSALDLAGAVLTVAQNIAREPDNEKLRGIFHVAGSGVATPAQFAQALFATAARVGGPGPRVVPIGSDEYVTRVRRPHNALLDCSRIAEAHGVTLPSWEEPLRYCVERFLTSR